MSVRKAVCPMCRRTIWLTWSIALPVLIAHSDRAGKLCPMSGQPCNEAAAR